MSSGPLRRDENAGATVRVWCLESRPRLFLTVRALLTSALQPRRASYCWRACKQSVGLVVLFILGIGAQQPVSAPARSGQAQVAGRFLRAVLRADYAAAYARLAPEVRRSVSMARFTAVAQPLWQRAHRHPEIELYKLGVRLNGNTSRLFYSFSLAADSSLKTPSVLLEVTFRDTTSRSVLGFGLRPTARPSPKK